MIGIAIKNVIKMLKATLWLKDYGPQKEEWGCIGGSLKTNREGIAITH